MLSPGATLSDGGPVKGPLPLPLCAWGAAFPIFPSIGTLAAIVVTAYTSAGLAKAITFGRFSFPAPVGFSLVLRAGTLAWAASLCLGLAAVVAVRRLGLVAVVVVARS
jgi:hypothetical protein